MAKAKSSHPNYPYLHEREATFEGENDNKMQPSCLSIPVTPNCKKDETRRVLLNRPVAFLRTANELLLLILRYAHIIGRLNMP